MAYSEEILIRMGFDASKVAQGLRGMKQRVSQFASSIGGQLLGAFSVGLIVNNLNKVVQKFGEIKERAENLNVSTDFFQGLGKVADVTNSSLENVEKSLIKLAQSMSKAREGEKTYVDAFKQIGISASELAGMSVEETFYRIADGFKATNDTTTKVGVSMDLLGRSGSELVTLLSKGGDEVQKLIDGVNKLTEEEIKVLARAKDDLKALQNEIELGIGKTVGWVAELARLLGRESVGDTRGQVATEMFEKARKEAEKLAQQQEQANLRAIEDAKKASELSHASDTKAIDLQKTLLAYRKAQSEEAARLVRWQEAGNRLAQMQADRSATLSDRSKFTLEELANRGAGPAQAIIDLEARAKDARFVGNFGAAEAMTNRALELRKGLGDYLVGGEANPFKSMDENIAAQRESLEKLGNAVQGDAIKIIPVNGK